MVYSIKILSNGYHIDSKIISAYLQKDKRVTKITIKNDSIIANFKYIMLEDSLKTFISVLITNVDKNKLFSYKYYEDSCEKFAL